MGQLIPPDCACRPCRRPAVATLTGKAFFPGLMSGPFKHGLAFAFSFSAFLYVLAALASWRGGMRRASEADPAARPAPEPSGNTVRSQG